jgi:hypothetical protein
MRVQMDRAAPWHWSVLKRPRERGEEHASCAERMVDAPRAKSSVEVAVDLIASTVLGLAQRVVLPLPRINLKPCW